MANATFVQQLLAAPHMIACIHEDELDSEFGITILYNEGTSYWKPLNSKEECEEVWKDILQMRPQRLAEFDDILFDPANVSEVGMIVGEDGGPELVISFVNHRFFSDLFFSCEGDQTDFIEGCTALVTLLSEHQNTRSNVHFTSTTAQ